MFSLDGLGDEAEDDIITRFRIRFYTNGDDIPIEPSSRLHLPISPRMRNPRCAFSAAAALHRVFILPAARPLISQFRPQLRPSTLTKSTTSTLFQHRGYASVLPRDEQIAKHNFPYVHLVDETGKLSTPQRVADILASLDRKTQSLHTVALPPPRLRSRWEQPPEAVPTPDSEEGPVRAAPEIPVCKIINKEIVRKAAKSLKKKPANPSQTVKTLELNWAIDPHDLGHRLRRMQEFLEKGYRVDVLLVGKRKKRKASPEEAAETLRRIREEAEGVEGAKEWKAMEGKVGGQVTVYLEGKPKKLEE
jgi:translation initiation factor IF-3